MNTINKNSLKFAHLLRYKWVRRCYLDNFLPVGGCSIQREEIKIGSIMFEYSHCYVFYINESIWYEMRKPKFENMYIPEQDASQQMAIIEMFVAKRLRLEPSLINGGSRQVVYLRARMLCQFIALKEYRKIYVANHYSTTYSKVIKAGMDMEYTIKKYVRWGIVLRSVLLDMHKALDEIYAPAMVH